jgi:hypothetical protein
MKVPFMMGMMGIDGDVSAGFETRCGPGAKRQVKDTDIPFCSCPKHPHQSPSSPSFWNRRNSRAASQDGCRRQTQSAGIRLIPRPMNAKVSLVVYVSLGSWSEYRGIEGSARPQVANWRGVETKSNNNIETDIYKMQTYSNNHLSNVFEIDRATALRALKEIAPDAERTKGRPEWKISTFAKALEAHHLRNTSNANDGATGSDTNSDTASLISARIRVANANAEQKERANAAARGELCNVETGLNLFAMAMGVMRETMLTMPGKLSDTLAAYSEHDRIQIFEILHREVVETLTALSSPETYVEAGVAFAKSRTPQPLAPVDGGGGGGGGGGNEGNADVR